jgi:hypothetical protein
MTTLSDPAAYFGRQVRKARRSRGWSLHEFGEQVVYHPAALSRIENGKRPPTETLAKACDRVFPECGGWFYEFFAESRGWMALPAWLRDWASHEQSARYLHDWCPSIVTGLLQTEEYARAVIATAPMVTDDEVSARGRDTGGHGRADAPPDRRGRPPACHYPGRSRCRSRGPAGRFHRDGKGGLRRVDGARSGVRGRRNRHCALVAARYDSR